MVDFYTSFSLYLYIYIIIIIYSRICGGKRLSRIALGSVVAAGFQQAIRREFLEAHICFWEMRLKAESLKQAATNATKTPKAARNRGVAPWEASIHAGFTFCGRSMRLLPRFKTICKPKFVDVLQCQHLNQPENVR